MNNIERRLIEVGISLAILAITGLFTYIFTLESDISKLKQQENTSQQRDQDQYSKIEAEILRENAALRTDRDFWRDKWFECQSKN